MGDKFSQRVGPLTVIPALLIEMGVQPVDVLRDAGLDGAALNGAEKRIPFVALGELLHHASVRTGYPHFGLLAGQRMSLSQLGLPGELLRYSPTLGAGLKAFAVYHHLNSEGMVTVVREEGGMVALGTAVYKPGARFVEQIYDGVLAMACNVMREICGSQWAPEKVLLSRRRPSDPGPYRRFFQAPCRFDSEQSVMLLPAHLLKRRMPEADSERFKECEAKAQAAGIELQIQLRRALRGLLLAGRSSGDEVAGILSMHRRTLNRRLKEEGVTFRELLDEVRFEAACQLLDTTTIPLTDIAGSLGYAESSAFTRAFQRWSGSPPSLRRSQISSQSQS
ncbi:MAG TPA: AraC family transcriptional regulator [Candidatus Binataceae bacterium]|nr:AraC family transcriptional regulator [Candidatus Binataceae bacterium]